MFAACCNRNGVTLEDEARWAIGRRYAATGFVPNFLPHLYLDAPLAVRPERVTVLR
jgi:NitT/TauT family transport system substrate-binding protein